MKIKNAIYAAISVVITLLLCKHFTSLGTTTWYVDYNKPAITPPNIVFPIVWNILYILLAVSFYKILSANKNKKAVVLYLSQLVLQVFWCYAFFATQQMIVGLIVLAILNILAVLMTFEFKKINKKTLYMLLPFNIWLFFAFILNFCFITKF